MLLTTATSGSNPHHSRKATGSAVVKISDCPGASSVSPLRAQACASA